MVQQGFYSTLRRCICQKIFSHSGNDLHLESCTRPLQWGSTNVWGEILFHVVGGHQGFHSILWMCICQKLFFLPGNDCRLESCMRGSTNAWWNQQGFHSTLWKCIGQKLCVHSGNDLHWESCTQLLYLGAQTFVWGSTYVWWNFHCHLSFASNAFFVIYHSRDLKCDFLQNSSLPDSDWRSECCRKTSCSLHFRLKLNNHLTLHIGITFKSINRNSFILQLSSAISLKLAMIAHECTSEFQRLVSIVYYTLSYTCSR